MKFLRLLARVRYWKQRALKAEAHSAELIVQHEDELIALREQMEAERYRNISREDTFVSASILGARGMWGMAPRLGPAQTQKPPSLLEMANQSGPVMTGADRMEFEQYWWPDAMRNNVTRQQAEKDFLQELVKRKALNDEPISM